MVSLFNQTYRFFICFILKKMNYFSVVRSLLHHQIWRHPMLQTALQPSWACRSASGRPKMCCIATTKNKIKAKTQSETKRKKFIIANIAHKFNIDIWLQETTITIAVWSDPGSDEDRRRRTLGAIQRYCFRAFLIYLWYSQKNYNFVIENELSLF